MSSTALSMSYASSRSVQLSTENGQVTATASRSGAAAASCAPAGSFTQSSCLRDRLERFADQCRCYCPEPPEPPPPPPPPPPCPEPDALQVDPCTGIITTPGGYQIEQVGQYEWKITGPDGKETRVWGDPHVDESDGGKWDFKEDSTFVLPDGTQINVNTVPLENGMTVTQSIEVVNGDERVEVTGIDQGKGQVGEVEHTGAQYDTTGNDQFVMGNETDDWYFGNREIIGSENGGEVLKVGDHMPPDEAVASVQGQVMAQVPAVEPAPDRAAAIEEQLAAAFASLRSMFSALSAQANLSVSASASASISV